MIVALLAAVIAVEGAEAPTWQPLFSDPPRGEVFFDPGSVRTQGVQRELTVRFMFAEPQPGDVKEIVTRIELDCHAMSYRYRTTTAYDHLGTMLYSYDLPADRNPIEADMGLPSWDLAWNACRLRVP